MAPEDHEPLGHTPPPGPRWIYELREIVNEPRVLRCVREAYRGAGVWVFETEDGRTHALPTTAKFKLIGQER
jgi:hypothetical protein